MKRTRKAQKITLTGITGVLHYGKFHRVRNGHFLWKQDNCAPDNKDNKSVSVLLPGSLVLVTKKGRHRYVQVIYEELVGYIWCGTNIPLAEHFQPVSNADEAELSTL